MNEPSEPLKVECGNCDWTGTDDQISLSDVQELFERIDPGSEVPAGECPKCGCLAYLTKECNPYAHVREHCTVVIEHGSVSEVLSSNPKLQVSLIDFDSLDEDTQQANADRLKQAERELTRVL